MSEQSSGEKLYRLDIERVLLVNSSLGRTSFVFGPQSVFQFPFSLSFDCFGLENCLEVLFVEVLALWLFAKQTPIAHPDFIYFEEIWEARVPDYTIDVFTRGHRYERIIASRLRLAIGVKMLQVLLFDRAVAAWG